MKELTIEEKAKAYDEAIEKARQLCAYPTSKPFISDLQYLFPALAESEDEKISKDIISYVEQAIAAGYGIISKERKEKWIAWLEKQGEQKQWKAVDKEIYVKEPVLAQRKDKSEPNHGYVICYDHTLTPDVYERFIMISDIYNQSHY